MCDGIRTSRYELLKAMKEVLFDAQDPKLSTQEAWKLLWSLFVRALPTNLYLHHWYNVSSASMQWMLLGLHGQKDFMTETFHIDFEAMTRMEQEIDTLQVEGSAYRLTKRYNLRFREESSYVYPRSRADALGREIDISLNTTEASMQALLEIAVEQGLAEECLNALRRLHEVTSRSDPKCDDNCPICYSRF